MDEHVWCPVQRQQRKPSAMPSGLVGDRRLDIDPTIESRVENAARDDPMDIPISTGEEVALLASFPIRSDSLLIQDFDVDALLGPDVSGCPKAKRQVGSDIPGSSKMVPRRMSL